MELVQESLGHKSIKTTQNYFAGFPTDVKKKLSESLLIFGKKKITLKAYQKKKGLTTFFLSIWTPESKFQY